MQDVIEEYMARAAAATHSADSPDDENDDDHETQEDFNAFKEWLNNLSTGEPATSKPLGKPTPSVGKTSETPPSAEESRGSRDTPTCQLRKKSSSECYLMGELLELFSFCNLCLEG